MNRHFIVAFLVLGSLICATAGLTFPQGAKAETAGKLVQNEVSVSTFPRPSVEPGRDSGDKKAGDMLAAQTYNERTIRYAEIGELDLAISEFGKALEADPLAAETYNNRGITYSKKGQYDLAISDFTRALEIKPDMARACYNRGLTYAEKGQYARSLQDFDRSLEIDPIHAPGYANRGSLHVHLACSDWEKACQLGNCDHLKEAVKIGLCFKMNGNSDSSP